MANTLKLEIVTPDGSSHRAEVLLADALRAMLYAVTRGRLPAGLVGVSHPAHWRPSAVDALRGALAAVPEFGGPAPAALVSDAVAALTALQHDPGLPSRGVIAVCDFGETGTSITLADHHPSWRLIPKLLPRRRSSPCQIVIALRRRTMVKESCRQQLYAWRRSQIPWLTNGR